MQILELIKKATPDECRELGDLILSFADDRRDAAWHANLDSVIARFSSKEERGMAEYMSALGALHDALKADGMDHRSLIVAELERRGDARSYQEYAETMGMAPDGQFEGIRSNILPA